jgi:Tfp pilus assembly protein PilO
MKIRASSGLWLIVAALICVIVIVLALFLLILPQSRKVGDTQEEIDKVETSIQMEQNRLNQLKQYEKDPEQFLRQIDVLKERIPDDVELADIIQQIDHAAEESGLDFFSIIPQIPVSSGSFYTVTCEAVFVGRYFNLVEFFNHIERLPRSVKVVLLDIVASDDGLPYLQITVNFRCFFTTNQGIEGLVGAEAPSS